MANSITIRTTAPGAKEAATDLDKVKASSVGLGSTAKAAITGLGLAASAGFGLAAKGALEAQDAQGKFMAATGASREEAKKFVSGLDSLAGSAGTVGMKFDDLAALGTMVEQQFGTTGQKTIDLTENIAEFAKVTGQDAEGAAADLEDTLSAYGLTADDAAGFTDQLVASTQKYGTDVGPEQLDLLRKISPALQDMGGDLTDAVGYLNLMETAGIDAADAQRGFNTALTKMPPGSTFDDLLKHFGDLKAQGIDPTSEAIKIFGTRAGPPLAAAIKPGMQGLSDFAMSADDAKGSLKTAADAMVTDSDKIKGVAEKIVAGAREIGQDFGPALMGLASLGSLVGPLAAGGTDVVKKAAAKILPEAATQGDLIGKAMGSGMTGGLTVGSVGLGAAVAIAFDQASADAAQQISALGAEQGKLYSGSVSESIFSNMRSILDGAHIQGILGPGFSDALDQLALLGAEGGDRIGSEISQGVKDAIAAHAADDAREGMSQSGIATTFDGYGVLEDAGASATETIADGMAGAGPAVVDAGRGITDQFTAYWNKQRAFQDAGEKATADLVHGVESGIPDAHQAWKDYVTSAKDALDPMKEIAWLEARLTGDKLKEGLNSKDPIVRQAALDMQQTLQAQLDNLHALGYSDGEDMGQGVTSGLNSQADEAGRAAAAIMRRIEAALHDVRVNVDVNQDTSSGHHVPGGGRAAGGPVKKDKLYRVGERGEEWFVPNEDGTIIPNDVIRGARQAQPVGLPSGQPIVINMPPVMISSRELNQSLTHRHVVQAGGPAFR